jgi:hypothetical protein
MRCLRRRLRHPYSMVLFEEDLVLRNYYQYVLHDLGGSVLVRLAPGNVIDVIYLDL